MKRIIKSLRKEVLKLGNYSEGKKPKASSGASRIIKMASNENLVGSSPEALRAVENALKEGLAAYPDKNMTALKAATCEYWKKNGVTIEPSNLLFGDASGEVLNMLLAAFVRDGDTVIIPENSFILYSLLALPKGAKVREAKRRDFTADTGKLLKAVKKSKRPKMVIIANPDNPTSTMLTPAEIAKFMKKVPEKVAVVIDEAYIQFAGMENSAIGLLEKYPNLILVYTFSKVYGLASLRVGYGVMNESIAKQVEKIRLPFNLGSLQQAGAIAALSDDAFVRKTVAEINDGKKYLTEELERLGFSCLKPWGNFLFADFGKKSAEIVGRLEDNGVSVRVLTEFGYPSNYVRITIGKKEDNEYLAGKLKEIKSNLN